MNKNASFVYIFGIIAILVILYAGDPDLIDAIIYWIMGL